MKINSFINAGLAVTALTLSLLIAIVSQALGLMSDIANAERQHHRSLRLANELLQSSEELTRMARSYVITGNPHYERYFFEILDIRNGKRQRPSNYSTAYWYLADIGEASTSTSGDAIPLQELIRHEGLSERELSLLRQSQVNCDTLVKLEEQAFAAMKGLFDDGSGNFIVSRMPDRDMAISLLFSEQYKIEKSRIMLPLQQFMQELDSRTQVTLENLQFRFRQHVQLILIVLGLALLGVVLATIYMRHNILRPLKLLSHGANSIARGNYAAHFDIAVHNELAALGADFNSMAVAINRDINERKQSELSLRHAKEDTEKAVARLNAYIETIDQLALVSATDQGGRILHANSKFCEISGYREQELIGQNHRILNSGVHPKEFFIEMWKTIARGDVWHREVCNRSKSGELYWVDSVIMPHKDENGKIDRYISIRTDITARMRRELELREHIKENDCLQAIRVGMVESRSLEEACQLIFEHLVTAMQFPQITSVMIEIGGRQFASERYDKKLGCGLQAQIMSGAETLDWLRVFYSEDKPFLLPQEQRLIDIIASDLGRWLLRLQQSEIESALNDLKTKKAMTLRFLQYLEVRREEDRKSIARELHDELGQLLSTLNLEVALLQSKSAEVDVISSRMSSLVQQAMLSTRKLASGLRPASLDLGLNSAIKKLSSDMLASNDIDCKLQLLADESILNEMQILMIFRIVQEALSNVLRHAKASCVEITLRHSTAGFSVMVRDNGTGFDPTTSMTKKTLGLVGIGERVSALKGNLEINSAPKQGTSISVYIPYSKRISQ